MQTRDTRVAEWVKDDARAWVAGFLATLSLLVAAPSSAAPRAADVKVELYEWKIEIEPASVPSGPVQFEVVNKGSIPHAFEIEGHGVEKATAQIPAGGKTPINVTLGAGTYEAYCPIGNGSHKMLGMRTRLEVLAKPEAVLAHHMDHEMEGGESTGGPKTMRVTGGGAVIQILPGPFPFADSAEAVIAQRPAEQKADLEKKAHSGPYSNSLSAVSGTIAITATDRGAANDTVDGLAEFATQDGTRWKLVMDRVQTRDIPFNPRFGGVIMGLFYHGASGVHTPLVPTIQSSLALWAFGHLYRNEALVTDSAMVHVMLLSRTRREGDWALSCWDCSRNPIEELQLQVTPAPGAPPFEAPGGVLFLNWETSKGDVLSAPASHAEHG